MRGRIETRGSVVLGGASALAAAGLLAADGVLLSMGVVAAAWVGVAWGFGRWNLCGLTLEIEGPKTVRAGDSFRIRVTVSNGKRFLDSVAVSLRLEGPGGLDSECRIPWMVAQGEAMGDLRLMAAGRGEAVGFTGEWASRFPWGLLRIEQSFSVEHALTVLPRRVVPIE
ncbi:MAG: hypothetical protein ACQKBU_00055, partial [Verrucomicrobiales bacterium]